MLTMRMGVAAVLMAAVAGPAAAQFSDTFNFFKNVKKRDAYEAVKIIGEAGSAVVNLKDPDSGDTALVLVTRDRDLGWAQLLLSKGADVNGKGKGGDTALLIAAGLGWSDGARLFLGRGASVNAQNAAGETPLIRAVMIHDITTVRALTEAGANADKSDNTGKSARDYAADDRRYAPIAKVIAEGGKKPVMGPSR